MADRDGGQGQLHDVGTRRDGVRRKTADPADIPAVCSRRYSRSSTEQPCSHGFLSKAMCLDAGFPGVASSRLKPYPGCSGQRLAAFQTKKEAFMRKKAVSAGVQRQKSPFFPTARLTWAASSRKTTGKDGGVCRVIGTSTQAQQPENLSNPCGKSRIHPHFPTRI